MRLSSSFTLEEFIKSPTARRLQLDNTPSPAIIENLTALCTHVLQPVRNYFNLPVVINSGYRSANLNRAMGGASTSQHLYGQAADIEIPGVSNDLLWTYIVENLPFDQCIAEFLSSNDPKAGWVHVSYGPRARKEALSCISTGHYVKGLKYVA